MDGIILIDKPKGWTSFDVVAKIRGQLREKISKTHMMRGFCMEMHHKDDSSNAVKRTHEYVVRVTQISDAVGRSKKSTGDSFVVKQAFRCKCRVKVGHTGTLDPLATGLMIVVVGSYCKRAEEFSKLDKTYEVTMKLGETSTTGDGEGNKQKISDKKPSKSDLVSALSEFEGEIMQIPPVYSAIKIGGERAYKLARAGKEVKLEPRQVKINSIKLTNYSYPFVNFMADVSSGTYIRSLVEDIGNVLKTGAYMSDLRRTIVGKYKIEHSSTVENISNGDVTQYIQTDLS